MASPTFVCRFNDGVVTKMTTHCAPDALDLRRGIVLSRIAYRSRTKGDDPPPIASACFQTQDGVVLCEYDAKEITEETGVRHQGGSREQRKDRHHVQHQARGA